MKFAIGAMILFVTAMLALSVWARWAPIDPATWHVDLTRPGFAPPGANGAGFCPAPDARYVLAPSDLARLDAMAMAWPDTVRLAGSVEEGHISWVTRSRLMRFPDVTTAQIVGAGADARVCLIARQRIGKSDLGVNSRRLRFWLSGLFEVSEEPDLVWEPPV